MSSFGLLGLGIQGAQANKTALATVGQNITNASTEGYSRQEANFVSVQDLGGTQIASITRVTDQFLTQQLWSDTSSYNRSDAYAEMASQLDDRLATDSTSISTSMDNYFDALQNAVDDPTSLPNRELFIAQSEALVQRFNDLSSIIERQQDSINTDLESYSTQITAYASEVAELNEHINLADLSGANANELRDQREQVLTNLSELIDVRVVEQDGSQMSVFVGNGEPLVIGQNYNAIEAVSGDPDGKRKELAVNVSGTLVNITDFVTGGRIGGLLEYRTDVLNDAENELGRIAIAFADTMNDQHQHGMTLSDDLGGLLFTDVNSYDALTSRTLEKSDNNSTLSTSTVRIKDASALQASDYEINFNSSSSFTIERLSDGEIFRLSDLESVATEQDLIDSTNAYYLDENSGIAQIAIDGFQVNLDVKGKFFSGDEYLIQPSRYGAEQIGVEITDGNDLAFAAPVRITGDPNNTGSGDVEVAITDINASTFQSSAGALNPPVEIVFSGTDPLTYSVYDVSDANNPVILELENTGQMVDQQYVAGEAISLDGYDITISNIPDAGDRFSFEYNTDGASDNRNALAMSDLQLTDTLDGGSYQDIYGILIEKVGTKTSVAFINQTASQSVMQSTKDSKAEISGVNLDEEAAKLIQFQQAYQASAQLISTSQTLFDTLLNAT